LQRLLIDVIGFRGVGIAGFDGRQFVGRERQGIAIGRAMHGNADLILLDEPKPALLGAGKAELKTIMLHYLLSSEYF
jgi:ABC-type protease/lipase transport system fused ATPase/permease subunit